MQNHFSLAKEAPCPMKQPSHLHRDLVEATVRRVLAGVRTDPERELRKLVDLGADVSRGRFQRRFLTAAQHLLEDPDSSYYAIARELLSRADFDRLVAFGMALGYDGCTRGARLIRQIEAEHGFNIPWALSLETESARLSGGELDRWTALIAEGTRLGIHAYLLRCDDPAAAVPLAARQKNCAFLLFVRPDETGPRLLAALGKAPTCAVSVELAPGAQAACAALRQAGILHGVHWTYAALPEIRSGSWAGAVRHTGAPFGILIPAAARKRRSRRSTGGCAPAGRNSASPSSRSNSGRTCGPSTGWSRMMTAPPASGRMASFSGTGAGSPGRTQTVLPCRRTGSLPGI